MSKKYSMGDSKWGVCCILKSEIKGVRKRPFREAGTVFCMPELRIFHIILNFWHNEEEFFDLIMKKGYTEI